MEDETAVDNIALGFRDLSVSTHDTKMPIIHKVNGYVARGCMTAGKYSSFIVDLYWVEIIFLQSDLKLNLNYNFVLYVSNAL